MTKPEILARIKAGKIIALIRTDGPDALLDCATALAAGGIDSLELTLTTPGAIEMCAKVSRELPHILVGMGTILDIQTARAAIDVGAKFLVTPAVNPPVIKLAREADVPVFGGALTPTEIFTTWELGADVVKIFPAEFFGAAYIKSIKAPFPQIEIMPTGGVTPETIDEFLRNGAFAAAAGSALVSPAALKARDWSAITARAKQFVAAVNAT